MKIGYLRKLNQSKKWGQIAIEFVIAAVLSVLSAQIGLRMLK